jgi:carbonic anhydrase
MPVSFVPLAWLVVAVVLVAAPARADAPAPARSPDEALRALLDGNGAFVAGGASCARQTAARRGEVAAAQHPLAVVVGCADSRVPPEAVFGQGIGDLFVIRVAGNVIDDTVLGSIEYAVEHLGAPLVIVLGHERCGAVQAALASEPAPAHVDAIVRRIRAAIADARTKPGDAVDNAVRANVAASVRDVQASMPVLAPMVQKRRIKVVGARYDLDTGAVELVR